MFPRYVWILFLSLNIEKWIFNTKASLIRIWCRDMGFLARYFKLEIRLWRKEKRLRAWGAEREIYSSWMVISISNRWFNQDKQNPYKRTFLSSSFCPNSNAWTSSQLTQCTNKDQESGGCGNRRTSLRIWKLGWDVVLIKVQDGCFFFFRLKKIKKN